MQKPVSEALRVDATRKEEAMAEARQALDTAYAWLDETNHLPRRGRHLPKLKSMTAAN
jgi:hypothetical protein